MTYPTVLWAIDAWYKMWVWGFKQLVFLGLAATHQIKMDLSWDRASQLSFGMFWGWILGGCTDLWCLPFLLAAAWIILSWWPHMLHHVTSASCALRKLPGWDCHLNKTIHPTVPTHRVHKKQCQWRTAKVELQCFLGLVGLFGGHFLGLCGWKSGQALFTAGLQWSLLWCSALALQIRSTLVARYGSSCPTENWNPNRKSALIYATQNWLATDESGPQAGGFALHYFDDSQYSQSDFKFIWTVFRLSCSQFRTQHMLPHPGDQLELWSEHLEFPLPFLHDEAWTAGYFKNFWERGTLLIFFMSAEKQHTRKYQQQ